MRVGPRPGYWQESRMAETFMTIFFDWHWICTFRSSLKIFFLPFVYLQKFLLFCSWLDINYPEVFIVCEIRKQFHWTCASRFYWSLAPKPQSMPSSCDFKEFPFLLFISYKFSIFSYVFYFSQANQGQVVGLAGSYLC